MFAKTRSFALAAAVASGLAVASPLPALADGSPVVSLGIALVGPMRLPFYNTTAAPVTTARVIGYGQAPDFAPIYDTSVQQGVTSRPVSDVQGSGENLVIRYNDEDAARATHAMPNSAGRHNPALSNLEALPMTLR